MKKQSLLPHPGRGADGTHPVWLSASYSVMPGLLGMCSAQGCAVMSHGVCCNSTMFVSLFVLS